MFIQNKKGEVVNVDQILAIKVCCNDDPYEIHVFTEKTVTVFEIAAQGDVNDTISRIEGHLVRACLRWAECGNWRFRADKILSINESPCRDLQIAMIGRSFHIHVDVNCDGKGIDAAKKQIADSLSENLFNSTAVVFERIE